VYSGVDRSEVIAALDSGRESRDGPARLVVVGDANDPARRWLTDGGPRPNGVAYADRPVTGEVAFVFTNGSASYPGMGRDLALAFPRTVPDFQAADGPGVLDRIWSAAVLSGMHADVSRDVLGLQPDAAIGYSSGESAALGALGAWHDMAGLLRDLRASDLFSSGLTGEYRALRRAWRDRGLPATGWASYQVEAPPDRVRAALGGARAVHMMLVNTPSSCVIGGEEGECAAVLRRLGDVTVVPLDFPIAAHVPELAAVADEYRRLHLRPTRDVPGLRFYSGATGETYRATAERAADAILAQATGTVDFVRVIERAYADGVRVFVEHGPQARCTGWIRQILAGREHVAVALDSSDGVRQLLVASAELVAAGVTVRAEALVDHLAEAAARPTRPGATAGSGPSGAAPRPSHGGATVRLAAHPPELRLPGRDEPVAMPPAPPLPPVPRRRPVARPAPAGPDGGRATLLPTIRLQGVPASTGAAEQFGRVSALHQSFVVRQAQAHDRFLAALATRPVPVSTADSVDPVDPVDPVDTVSFDRADLERLADGHVAKLFGPRFDALAGRRRLTRLPTPPMLLVDRVTAIDAVPASMGTGTIRTETDIARDAWYLDACGRMPAGIMVEAGQADLLLISWLGVDLDHTDGGDRVYRLLGCELTYHASPATVGETLRYEIHVDGHAEHDGVRLFFFHYDCRVGDRPRMTVREGQAGFFTDAELAESTGLRWDPAREPPTGPEPAAPVALPTWRRFDAAAVRAFAEGRPADCFGPRWTVTRAHVRSPRIDGGRMLLLDVVADLDPAGGPWRRGYLRAETAVSPDDWFFDGHFTNDPCMPGTLMFQGGLQAMAFYLAALGFTVDRDGWRFEPVPEEPVRLRCRGQVAPSSRRVTYEVYVRELSTDPYPTLRADVLGTVDGVGAFLAEGAALRLVPDWPEVAPTPGSRVDGVATVGGVQQDIAALLACARGPMARAMGPAFAGFDVTGRRAPRLPGPPYHVMSRVVAVDGEFGAMRAGATVTAEYDVTADAWYFEASGAATMPLAVLMEVVLQPCGWLAMYLGSVLGSDEPLLFRNLDGTGTVHRGVAPGLRTLRTRVTSREISRYGGMIIESFSVSCAADDGAPVFDLETVFGFFPPSAFADQPGLAPTEADRTRLARPATRVVDLTAGSPGGAPPRLPEPALLMLDRITGYEPDGGAHGLGWVRGEKDVDPDDWYFKAHFFSDPVQPGSLGVQALCSLLQWYLLERGAGANSRFEAVRTGHPFAWRYRGQVVPTDGRVTVELDVTGYGTDGRGTYATADGWLWVDGRRIYQVTGLGARAVPGT
jgi:3-hydroxymyristoyl/3-hydroxydecanoyl-(acyl carrier protein) dehydratase/malonyl CoA-acyl carrier protein transacylase